MSHPESNRLHKKGGIAGRARNISLVLFALMTALMTAIYYFHRPPAVLPVIMLFLYAAGQSLMMRRLFFRPLSLLAQSLAEAGSGGDEIFGPDRDDEIGELARTIREMRAGLDACRAQMREEGQARRRQAQLLNAVNSLATVLLVTTDEKKFEALFHEGMEIMGLCVDVDRVYLWRNELINGSLYYSRQSGWLSDFVRWSKIKLIHHGSEKFPYSRNPEWEAKFLRGECVTGSVSSLPRADQDMLRPSNIKSVLMVPLHLQGRLWGFISFDDCRRERIFTEDEISVLCSGGLMLVNALNRYQQTAKINQTYAHTRMLLDAAPFICHLWDKNLEIFECNEETIKVFKLNSKHEFLDRFPDFSPKYQPDGELSARKAARYIQAAFEEGRFVAEWMHQLLDGTLVPIEITLVRINYGDDYVVAVYGRDLREHKRMMKEIEQRDNLLHTVNRAATVLLATRNVGDFEASLLEGIELMGRSIDVDRVYIWRNERVDGELYFAKQRSWLGRQGTPGRPVTPNVRFPYREHPEWEAKLSRGECVNGPVYGLSPGDRDFMELYGAESVLFIPVFLQGDFWGFVSFGDCRKERYFTGDEIDILRSGSLMIVNALLHNANAEERIRLQAELEKALKEAREASQTKSGFLARMSHEMRTPLNAIVGLSELALESGGSGNSLLNLEKIYNAGQTLLSTVNDILDISKIEAGKFELVPAAYDIPSLINDTITQSVMYMGEKPIKFMLDIDESLPTHLCGDELRIKQICNNLLSNAFKYTREGTVELGVSCAREGDSVWMTIRVRDTGIGVRPEDTDKLFAEYAQLDKTSNRTIGGTGLGLPITKRIVEMMGGTIAVESEYGRGCVFTVRLPQKFVTEAVIGPEVANNLKNFRYSDQKRHQNAKLARITLPYARVLVVDDVETNLDVAKGMMKPYGMRIDGVTSGRQAVDAIRDEKVRYNAVFMDHMMPEMDGLEAARIIREEIGTEYARTIPIIALTANAITGNEEMFLNNGFQAFLPKPIEVARLDSIIRRWVRDQELEKNREIEGSDEAPPTETARSFPGQVDGLDLQSGFSRFGCDLESFLQVLRSYAVNTRPLLESAKKVHQGNLADYAITVHGLKGSSLGVGAYRAGNLAEALEKAAASGDFDFVAANNAAFIEIVEKLVGDLETLLREMAAQKPKKEKPDRGVLARLAAACEAYEMDAVDSAMAELEAFEYEADNGLAAWLRENVDLMNFQPIKDKLSSLGIPGRDGLKRT